MPSVYSNVVTDTPYLCVRLPDSNACQSSHCLIIGTFSVFSASKIYNCGQEWGYLI